MLGSRSYSPIKSRSIRPSTQRTDYGKPFFYSLVKASLDSPKARTGKFIAAPFARIRKVFWPLSGFIFFEHTYRRDAMIPSFLNQLGQVLQHSRRGYRVVVAPPISLPFFIQATAANKPAQKMQNHLLNGFRFPMKPTPLL